MYGTAQLYIRSGAALLRRHPWLRRCVRRCCLACPVVLPSDASGAGGAQRTADAAGRHQVQPAGRPEEVVSTLFMGGSTQETSCMHPIQAAQAAHSELLTLVATAEDKQLGGLQVADLLLVIGGQLSSPVRTLQHCENSNTKAQWKYESSNS